MTAVPLASAVAEARTALTAIGTLARTADRVSAEMQIPRTLARARAERDQLRALASCIGVLADTLGARLGAIDDPGREHPS